MKSLVLPIILALSFVAAAQSPAAVERQILDQLKEIGKYGTYTGDYDETKNDNANKNLRDTLVRYGNRLDILRFAFPKLKNQMFVTTSRDGKLRIYSWDLETGGTMHDYDNVFQYQGADGKVYTWAPAGDDESGGAFYTQIFQVSAKAGPIYLANSLFIAEGSLHGQSIEALQINGDKLDPKPKLIRTGSGLQNSIDFSYDPFSGKADTEDLVHFDPVKQEFRFPVVIEDKEHENGRITNRFITYRFNGQYFVKVS